MRLPQFNQDTSSALASAGTATLTSRVTKAGRLRGIVFGGSVSNNISVTSLTVGSENVVPNGDALPIACFQPDGVKGAFLDLSAYGWSMKIGENAVAAVVNTDTGAQDVAMALVIDVGSE